MSEAGGWVEFIDRFNFIPKAKPNTAVVYPKGHIGRVTREAYDQAIAQGKAVPAKAPTTRPAIPDAKEETQADAKLSARDAI